MTSSRRYRDSRRPVLAGTATGALTVALATAVSAQQANSYPEFRDRFSPGSPYAIATVVPSNAGPPLAFTGVTVIDVTTGRLAPAQTVVIDGPWVKAVGPTRRVRIPKGAQVVDARGKFMIPGLWDMHSHPWGRTWFYPLSIAGGVTGLREMSTQYLDSMLSWRHQIAAGTRVGPRIVGTGGYLAGVEHARHINSSTPGPPLAIGIETPEDARRAVDSLKAAGVDFIKSRYKRIPPDAYFAALAEARRLHIPFVGHSPAVRISSPDSAVVAEHFRRMATDVVVDSGQRSIEHFSGPLFDFSMDACRGTDGVDTSRGAATELPFDPKACDAYAARLTRNKVWFTPTYFADGDPADPAIRRLWERGVPILAGSDAMGSIPAGVVPVHEELVRLVRAGLTPLGALQAATVNAAAFFDATDSLGTVAAGKLADVVVLDGNPLVDIHRVSTVWAVVANGRYFDRAALDALRAAGQQAADECEAVSFCKDGNE